jgi:hypothetical protein
MGRHATFRIDYEPSVLQEPTMADPSTLYERDFFAWTQDQAAALRRAQQERINAPIDWAHLADELEELGGSIKDAIQSHLATVIEHLLKLEHSPDGWPRKKWQGSVRKARRHLDKKIATHPSLASYPRVILTDAWLDGRDDALQDDSIVEASLPEECPYTLEQLRDPDWWPENRHGLDTAGLKI